MKHAATSQAPLHSLTSGATKRDKRPIKWTSETERAFEETKQQLANAFLLTHPSEGSPLILYTDASDIAIGATLQQI